MRNSGLALSALLALIAACLLVAGCNARAQQPPAITGGDAQRGRAAIFRYGCGSCHTIAGIDDARGLVGPPLTGIARRMYVGGVLPNTPDNLIRWIQNPKQVDEKTAMPALGVKAQDATDIAAYLYSIQ